MTEQNQKQLGKTLWAIADQLRGATHQQLVDIEKAVVAAKAKHNEFLKELGLKLLP
mgnify:CR=1 FL=1